MAWFNPNPVSFQPSKGVIDASGAFGRSLYDIYQNNVKNAQEQMKIDETERNNQFNNAIRAGEYEAQQRQNDINNKLNQDKFDYTKNKDERDFNFNNEKFAYTKQNDERNFNANQAYRNAVLAQNARNHADTMELARQKANNANVQDYSVANAFLNDSNALKGLGFSDDEISTMQNNPQNALGAINNRILTMKANKSLGIDSALPQNTTDGALNLGIKHKNQLAEVQKRIMNANNKLDLFAPYMKDLENAESQASGILDTITAPMGRGMGLNSDKIANLYAQQQALAELNRNQTKGGGYANFEMYKNAIDPVNPLFGTTVQKVGAQVASELQQKINVIEQAKSQGYHGADLEQLENEVRTYINAAPPQFKAYLEQKLPQYKSDKKWEKVGGDNNATTQPNSATTERPPLESFLN